MLASGFIGTRMDCEPGWRRLKLAGSSLLQAIWSQPATMALTGKCYNPNRETRIRNPIFAGDGVPGPEPRPAAACSTAYPAVD